MIRTGYQVYLVPVSKTWPAALKYICSQCGSSHWIETTREFDDRAPVPPFLQGMLSTDPAEIERLRTVTTANEMAALEEDAHPQTRLTLIANVLLAGVQRGIAGGEQDWLGQLLCIAGVALAIYFAFVGFFIPARVGLQNGQTLLGIAGMVIGLGFAIYWGAGSRRRLARKRALVPLRAALDRLGATPEEITQALTLIDPAFRRQVRSWFLRDLEVSAVRETARRASR